VKHKVLKFSLVIIIILSLLLPMTALAVGDVVYTNTRAIADNLELRNAISWHATHGRTESFTLTLTGEGSVRPIIMHGDTIFGTTRISTMMEIAEGRGHNVLAAVNADFFFTANGGVPMGIVIENGVYLSSPGGRNAVVFDQYGNVDILTAPTVRITLENHGGSLHHENLGEIVNLGHFNKPRTDHGGMVLYSEVFSTVSTRTNSPGWFVRFRVIEGVPSLSAPMTLEVVETFTSEEIGEYAVEIGEGYLVLTAADMSGLAHEFEKFAVGDMVTKSTSASDRRLVNAQFATGSGYLLVSGGAMTDPENWSAALQNRAPRTAFGVREDGSVIAIVVDGRNAHHSVGLTLRELAEELIRQGAVYAVNFDGGGSSAMSLRMPGESGAATISQPSDGSERGCATYLVFVTDSVPGGPARNLGLRNDGIIVLAGSTVTLAPLATDAGFMPAAVPPDVQVSALVPGATVNGLQYTAGFVEGPDRLRLYSPSTGALGEGEIFVLTRPTSITARRAGSTAALSTVRLTAGEVLELDVIATFYRRAVVAQIHSFEFDITGDIGEMSEPGVFVAGERPAQRGTITVSAGGRSTVINVEVGGFDDMQNHWGREYAEFLASEGVTIGVSPTEFGPERPMLRGDFILMLHRAAGEPEPAEIASFADVSEEIYFAEAMAWAMEAGIASGSADTLFNPLEPITRATAFTFTFRALSHIGVDVQPGSFADLELFPDAGDVADFAVVPVATLISLGIVEGSNGLLIPESTLTRAQMAKVLAMVIQLGE